MGAACRDPRHGRACEARARALHPFPKVLLRHPPIVGHKARQVHRVIDAGVVQVQRKAVIRSDTLLDLLQSLDLYAVARLPRIMVEEYLFVGRGAEGPYLREYGVRVHFWAFAKSTGCQGPGAPSRKSSGANFTRSSRHTGQLWMPAVSTTVACMPLVPSHVAKLRKGLMRSSLVPHAIQRSLGAALGSRAGKVLS